MSGVSNGLLHIPLEVIKFFEVFGTGGAAHVIQRTVWMAGKRSVMQCKVWSAPPPSPASGLHKNFQETCN